MDYPALNHLLLPQVHDFIKRHANSDVRKLALKKSPDPSWNYSLIMDQIKTRQRAKIKSPDLYETDKFIFPPSNLFEQASSSACAIYKAKLTRGVSFIDLTAGAGVDAYHISKNFDKTILVERDKNSAELLEHNMALLSQNITIHHGDALEYLQKTKGKVDLIFIDPQRRENGRKGIFDLSSCSPDIISLLSILKEKTKKLIIKTSPVLDLEKAIISLQYVVQLHVVQWKGECKEVLYELDFASKTDIENIIINAVNIDNNGNPIQKFTYKISDEKTVQPQYHMPQKYIYEPDPAFMKSGGFKSIATQLNINKIDKHSHLYTSDNKQENFPGKIYEFIEIKPAKAKGLNIKKANLTLRNFPSSINDLKKKLKISDGGEHKVFATTLCNKDKKLIICKKI